MLLFLEKAIWVILGSHLLHLAYTGRPITTKHVLCPLAFVHEDEAKPLPLFMGKRLHPFVEVVDRLLCDRIVLLALPLSNECEP